MKNDTGIIIIAALKDIKDEISGRICAHKDYEMLNNLILEGIIEAHTRYLFRKNMATRLREHLDLDEK